MTYERFEDLPVWKRAMDLAEKVYALTEADQCKKKYSLRDQIERAALSAKRSVKNTGTIKNRLNLRNCFNRTRRAREEIAPRSKTRKIAASALKVALCFRQSGN